MAAWTQCPTPAAHSYPFDQALITDKENDLWIFQCSHNFPYLLEALKSRSEPGIVVQYCKIGEEDDGERYWLAPELETSDVFPALWGIVIGRMLRGDLPREGFEVIAPGEGADRVKKMAMQDAAVATTIDLPPTGGSTQPAPAATLPPVETATSPAEAIEGEYTER